MTPGGPLLTPTADEREAAERGDAVFDAILLGMGPDGHTASLFPYNPALDADGTVVGVRDAPKPPPERVSLSLEALNSAHRLVLLVTGTEKAPMLARVIAGVDP